MIAASTKFYPLRADVEGMSFDLVPNPGLDMRTYRVRVGIEDDLFSCGCNGFEMCGLVCPHIIRVMVHLNVQQIPERYMLHRWSAASTTPAPDPGTNSSRFGVPPTNTLKYNALCRKMNDLASDACFADDTYEVVSSMIGEAAKIVATMKRARNEATQDVEGSEAEEGDQDQNNGPQQQGVEQDDGDQNVAPDSSNLRNPARVKPKGRPKLKEQRRKPLVELRDEAAAKRRKKAKEPKTEPKNVSKKPRKKRVKKCPFCYEEGHTLKDCGHMKAAKLARESELAAGALN